MRVLKRTKENNSYPRRIICSECESELEYEENDLFMGSLGEMHILCPVCNERVALSDNEKNITLTKDNIKFPEHFFYSSVENGAVNVDDEEIQKDINRLIEFLRTNKKEEFDAYTEHGNAHVSVFRFTGDEEYHVVVAKNYYDTFIPFEKEDY